MMGFRIHTVQQTFNYYYTISTAANISIAHTANKAVRNRFWISAYTGPKIIACLLFIQHFCACVGLFAHKRIPRRECELNDGIQSQKELNIEQGMATTNTLWDCVLLTRAKMSVFRLTLQQ